MQIPTNWTLASGVQCTPIGAAQKLKTVIRAQVRGYISSTSACPGVATSAAFDYFTNSAGVVSLSAFAAAFAAATPAVSAFQRSLTRVSSTWHSTSLRVKELTARNAVLDPSGNTYVGSGSATRLSSESAVAINLVTAAGAGRSFSGRNYFGPIQTSDVTLERLTTTGGPPSPSTAWGSGSGYVAEGCLLPITDSNSVVWYPCVVSNVGHSARGRESSTRAYTGKIPQWVKDANGILGLPLDSPISTGVMDQFIFFSQVTSANCDQVISYLKNRKTVGRRSFSRPSARIRALINNE